jgi:hypothetical protein
MNRTIRRIRGKEFCDLEISLEEGRLSICGTAGEIITPKSAKAQALEYWKSYFVDCPEEITAMNERLGTAFRSPTSAARYVLRKDGEYHGLNVMAETKGRIFIGHSFGQIREELADFFPEAIPYFRWHLNDMHGECAHQEARGETCATHPWAICFNTGCRRETEVTDAWGRSHIEVLGYKIGSAWLTRALPAEVIQWAETFEAKP